MPKLTVLCMILEMLLVMSKQSYYLYTYCLDLYGSQLWNYSSIDITVFLCSVAQNYKTPMKVTNTTHVLFTIAFH